jgi:hypothetical protein
VQANVLQNLGKATANVSTEVMVHVKIQVYIELLTYTLTYTARYIHYTLLRANRGPGTEKYRRKYCTFEFIFKIMET